MELGYVKFWRSVKKNTLLAKDAKAFTVFTRLLLEADRDGKVSIGRKQLADLTILPESTAWGALCRLERHQIIYTVNKRSHTDVHFLNWSKYQVNLVNQKIAKMTDSKPTGSPTGCPTANDPCKNDVDRQAHRQVARQQTDTIQEERIVDTNVSTGSREPVDNFLKRWEEVVGFAIEGQQKANRLACANLLKKYTAEGLESLLRGVKYSFNDQFAPRISDYVSLQRKQNELIAWGKRRGKDIKQPEAQNSFYYREEIHDGRPTMVRYNKQSSS